MNRWIAAALLAAGLALASAAGAVAQGGGAQGGEAQGGVAQGGGAQGGGAPDADSGDARHFTPDWDAVCAGGQDLGQGCDRIRARRVVDAAAAPWRAIGRVNFASTRIRGHCTGTLVGERLVATAAHCLFNAARRSWIPPESLVFAAGYQRGAPVARAMVTRYVVSPALAPGLETGLKTGHGAFTAEPWEDWALLVLEDPIGRETGWFETRAPAPGTRARGDLVIAGYSGLREHVLTLAEDCGPARTARGGALIVQSCAVMRGDSGGPVLAMGDGKPVLVGVVSVVFAGAATGGGRSGEAGQGEAASGAVSVAVFAEALAREAAADAGGVDASPAPMP